MGFPFRYNINYMYNHNNTRQFVIIYTNINTRDIQLEKAYIQKMSTHVDPNFKSSYKL